MRRAGGASRGYPQDPPPDLGFLHARTVSGLPTSHPADSTDPGRSFRWLGQYTNQFGSLRLRGPIRARTAPVGGGGEASASQPADDAPTHALPGHTAAAIAIGRPAAAGASPP